MSLDEAEVALPHRGRVRVSNAAQSAEATARALTARDRRRSAQQQALADAALAMSSATTVDDLLRTVTEAAQSIIGTHQAVTSRLVHGWSEATTYVSLSDKYAEYRAYDQVPRGLGVLNAVTRENRPLRLTGDELQSHPEWRGLRDAPGHPPLPNYLGVPLVGRDGNNLGLIQLSDKAGGDEFTAEDEAMLVQLAQLASAAIQNIELVERERSRRTEIEREVWQRGLLSEAGRAFAACLDEGEVVEALGRSAIPALADALVIHTVGEGAALGLLAVLARNDEDEALLRDLIETLPVTRHDPVGAGAVARTGQSEVVRHVSERLLAAVSRDEQELARLRETGLEEAIVVPLTARGRVMGTVSLVRQRSESFDDDHLAFAEELAQRAALALDNVRMLSSTHELASRLEQTLDHLSLALDAAQMGTWEWEIPSGKVRWSEALEAIYGFETGTFPGTFEAYEARIHPSDRDQVLRNLRRAIDRCERFDYRYRIVRADGTAVRWIEGAGLPLLDESGELTGMAGVCIDATERVVADQKLRREARLVETLHEMGKAIVSRLDLDAVVQSVTDAGRALTGADIAAFFYNVEDGSGGEYRLFALSGVPRSHFEQYPMPRNTEIFAPTFGGDGPVRLDDVTADARYGKNAPYFGMPEGHFPVRSYLAVPVLAPGGAVIGGLFFGHQDVGVFTEDDERLAHGLAAQAAIAIENARLYEEANREIEARRRAFEERDHVARVLQRSLLPPDLPTIPDMDFAARYRPGSHDVGGDFYDVFPLRGRTWGIAIGDVCGKGPEAAALTALTRHALRTAGMIHRHPSQAMRTLNEAVLRSEAGTRFCSAVLARLRVHDHRARLWLALGGHPQPIVLRADGTIERVGHLGTVLGVVPEIEVQDQLVELSAGDALVFYTDGLTDARRSGQVLGHDRVTDVLAGCRGESAEGIAKALEDAVTAFVDERLADDLAILVARVI